MCLACSVGIADSSIGSSNLGSSANYSQTYSQSYSDGIVYSAYSPNHSNYSLVGETY